MRKIGTTVGLSQSCGVDRPEQVYVYVDDADDVRPIEIHGWVGYSIETRMGLTRAQAKDLIGLLAEAIVR